MFKVSYLPYQTKIENITHQKPIIDIISVTQHKEAAMLILSENGIEKDFVNIIGQNIPRIIKNKKAYDIIFKDKKQQQIIEDMFNPLSQMDLKKGALNNNDVIENSIKILAKSQRCFYIRQVDLSQYNKLYILGHGSAGNSKILSGNTIVNSEELVTFLEKSNILKSIKDIRLTSCGSADCFKLPSIKKEDVEKSREILNKSDKGTSLLTSISTLLWKQGYTDIRISGYHGQGVFGKESDTEPVSYHLRSAEIPAKITQRRSVLRTTLISEID
ncbi:hypothetical protein ETN89_21035 (plasmid) [Photobacterium damselae subsp. damselae]|uniref:hypothetical protein n=1 Tax=Photobacterium damselae TaxID=38293 RepID=UPI000A2FE4D2|nr:hypothetical protein [Photobacterium damselae]ARR51732.1 hypothetical protein CAY62_20160 [Photobacterium damselae subsp. damselae]QAY37704.1 hypothetical protein ETN89_21035 [Photobacterium damselae subsp. damselae]